MTLEARLRPTGPYSLPLTARRGSDATRRFADGILHAVLPGGERVAAWQEPGGTVVVRGETSEGVERMRFLLALDDDHSEFLKRFRDDALLRFAIRDFRGLRQIRLATVAHALLRALCGQLIDSRTARRLERRIVATSMPTRDGLHEPPTREALGRLAPVELRALGLHARRGAALVRLCRSVDLERLHALPSAVAASRIERERGLGPWSAGVVCLEGLGRREVGLVGDLGLVKLCSALRGRRVETWETAELLEPYGEWAGLASVYLLAGFGAGLVPSAEQQRHAA